MESVAGSYGLAIFEIAKEDNQLDVYKKDLDFVNSALDAEALHFFNQRMIASDKRNDVLENCFKGSIQNNVLNFLKLLVVKGRFASLKDIVAEFHRLYNLENGILEGTLYTIETLTSEQLKAISQALSKKEGKKVLLNQIIDPTLLGGVKVVIGDHVYDGSIKNKISSLESELLKG